MPTIVIGASRVDKVKMSLVTMERCIKNTYSTVRATFVKHLPGSYIVEHCNQTNRLH